MERERHSCLYNVCDCKRIIFIFVHKLYTFNFLDGKEKYDGAILDDLRKMVSLSLDLDPAKRPHLNDYISIVENCRFQLV